MKPTKPKPPAALTVEWCGSYRVEFDAESVASDLDAGATDAAIRAAIENNAVMVAYDQSPASSHVRGVTDAHVFAVRKILKER